MTLEDVSFPVPQENLDRDEALLIAADRGSGGEVLRFWESPSVFVVLGRTGSAGDDVDQAAAARDGLPVLRRTSGGGTVLQGPGCLNFAVVLNKKRDPALETINGTYRYVLERVLKGLQTIGIDGVFRPVCDLALAADDRKFSGNAQRRGREHILHHGTLLYGFDLALVSRYLKLPKKMPEYRSARPHGAFVTNIPAAPAALRRVITSQFSG